MVALGRWAFFHERGSSVVFGCAQVSCFRVGVEAFGVESWEVGVSGWVHGCDVMRMLII